MRPAKARRLNGDTSWLLTLPYSEDGRPREFNLVLDPWLHEAEQVDMTFAFSVQSRVVKAATASLHEVDALLARGSSSSPELSSGQVDALVLSHPFTDHAHPQTLTDASNRAEIPLLGTPDALGSVRKLGAALPFTRLEAIPLASWEGPPSFEKEGQGGGLPLPAGIRIVRLAARERFAFLRYGPAWPKLHGALVFLWQTAPSTTRTNADGGPPTEPGPAPFGAVVYSPHGITPLSLPPWLAAHASPRILLHSLHRQVLPAWLAGPVALGFSNAAALCARGELAPHLLLGTHDERKHAGGVVARLIRRETWEAAEMEAQLAAGGADTRLLVLDVGEEVVLE